MEASSSSSSSSSSDDRTNKTTASVTATSAATNHASSAASTVTAPQSSDRIVSLTMQKGFENILIQTGTGLVFGFLAGVVLAHRGGSSGARKVFAGLGAGFGLGSSWTQASMNLEHLLSQPTPSQQQQQQTEK